MAGSSAAAAQALEALNKLRKEKKDELKGMKLKLETLTAHRSVQQAMSPLVLTALPPRVTLPSLHHVHQRAWLPLHPTRCGAPETGTRPTACVLTCPRARPPGPSWTARWRGSRGG